MERMFPFRSPANEQMMEWHLRAIRPKWTYAISISKSRQANRWWASHYSIFGKLFLIQHVSDFLAAV
jgi:hypothetical protein